MFASRIAMIAALALAALPQGACADEATETAKGLVQMEAAGKAMSSKDYPTACHQLSKFFDIYGTPEHVPKAYVADLGHPFSAAQGRSTVEAAAAHQVYDLACALAFTTVLVDIKGGNMADAERMSSRGYQLERALNANGAAASAAALQRLTGHGPPPSTAAPTSEPTPGASGAPAIAPSALATDAPTPAATASAPSN